MATSSTTFHVSTQTTVYLSTVLVDQTNYTAWMFRIEAFMKGQNLYGFVDGSIPLTAMVAKGSFRTGSYNGNHTHSRDGIPATCFPSSVSLPSHSQRMPAPGVVVHLSPLPTELMGDHNSVAVVSTSSDESVGTRGNGNDCNNVGSHNGEGHDDYDSGSNSAGSENASNHGCTSDFVDGSHVVTCEEDNIHVFNATIQGAYVNSNYSHDSNVGDQVDDSNADNNGGQNREEYSGGASGLNSEDNDVTHHDIDGLSSDIDGESGDSTSADMSNDMTGDVYAMKKPKKLEMLQRGKVEHVKAERNLLVEVDSNSIVKLYCSFQDDEYLYLIMELNLLVATLQEKRNTAIYAITCAREKQRKVSTEESFVVTDDDQDGSLIVEEKPPCVMVSDINSEEMTKPKNGSIEVMSYPQLVIFCERIDSEGLHKFISDNRKNLAVIREEILRSLIMAGDNNWDSDSDSSYVLLSDVTSVGSDSKNFVIVAKDSYLSIDSDADLSDERRHQLNVAIFVCDIIEINPWLRVSIITRLMDTFYQIQTSRVCTYALWIIGQYCLSLSEVKCGIATIKQCLGEFPFYTASVSSRRPVVLADGTCATQSTALETTMSAPVPVQGYLASEENLRSLILSSDFFLESVVACTLTKLVLRLEEVQPSKVEVNKATTQALLIMVSMLQLGQSFVLPYLVDNDSHDRIVLCIRMLCNKGEDVRRIWLESSRQSFVKMLEDKKHQEAEETRAMAQISNAQPGDLIDFYLLKSKKGYEPA